MALLASLLTAFLVVTGFMRYQRVFKKIYQEIRSFGGVVIADEVQSGFGRLGDQMWAYQDDAVVPDIVTMGNQWETATQYRLY